TSAVWRKSTDQGRREVREARPSSFSRGGSKSRLEEAPETGAAVPAAVGTHEQQAQEAFQRGGPGEGGGSTAAVGANLSRLSQLDLRHSAVLLSRRRQAFPNFFRPGSRDV